MTTRKKATTKKNVQSSKTITKPLVGSSGLQKLLKSWRHAIGLRVDSFLQRRPHRSFRPTSQRDYRRPLSMPGYVAFTHQVWQLLWRYKKLFLLLALLYGLLSAALVGFASQSTYDQLNESFKDTATSTFGNINELGKAGILLLTGMTGSLNETPTDIQRIFATLLGLMVWLTTIWLVRAVKADKKPKLRDGLYNASAPLLSTFLVSLVMVVQLLPVALAILAFGAAASTGLIEGGVEAMVFWAFAGVLALLSLYWLVGTFFALVVVTLPGMYPMKAVTIAGDLVVGRRLRIVLRFLWLLATILLFWAIVGIPIILLDQWLKGIWPLLQSVPVVPVALLIIASLSVVWAASYTYMLYRKVVDDGAAPA